MEVTYTYYLDVYGGNMIPESRWQSLELKARARLNHYTFNRMESGAWMAEAKAALCEMCEALFQENERGGKTSENTDGYSVGYDTSIPVGQKLYRIAEMYLQGTGLMDLGGGIMLTNAVITLFSRYPDKEQKKIVYLPHRIDRAWYHVSRKTTPSQGADQLGRAYDPHPI